MLNTVRMLLLGAAGAIELTEEKVRAIADDFVRRGELAADEARELTAQWVRGRATRRDELDDRIREAVVDALGQANVASQASVVDLERRIAAIEHAFARVAAPGDER
ncbi:MAG: hypothetical protein IT184_02490 [Acidobacteria bacterium]|nr:hypothetical protein [Acidobacteriota bacterium]